MQGSFFAGIAIGPMIGGWIVEITNDLLSVFYVIMIMNTIIFLFVLFILPESLTEEKLLENLKSQQESLSFDRNRPYNTLLNCIYNIFKPLTIFFPSNSIVNDNDKSKTKYSLLLLTIVSSLISAAITGIQAVFLLYTTLVFNWSLMEQGYLIFVMGISRVLFLFILFPIFVSNFKRHILLKNVDSDERSRKEFMFEVWILRLSLLIDAISYFGYGLATSSSMFIGGN